MIIQKKSNNILVQMDNIYLNNFSYNRIDLKINELLEKFSEKEVLSYFLTRIQVKNVDHNIMKFLYPIFKLRNSLIEDNIEQVVKSLNDSIIEFMVKYIGKDKIQLLMSKYLEYHLYHISYEDVESIKALNDMWDRIQFPNFTKSDKQFSKLFQEVFYSTEVQNAMCFLIKDISLNLDMYNRDLDSLLHRLLDEVDNSNLEKIKSSLINLVKSETTAYTNSYRQGNISVIFRENLFDDELIIEIINFINNSDNQSDIYSSIISGYHRRDKLFSSQKANESINIDSFVKVAKSIDINEWKSILKKFDDLGINNDEQRDKYVSRITSNILKWQNLRFFYKDNGLDYYLSLLKKYPKRYEEQINKLSHHIVNYRYRIWRIRFDDERRWLRQSISKSTPKQKAIIVLHIGKTLIELYGLNEKVNDFVHYVIESPSNSPLLQHIVDNLDIKQPHLEDIASKSIQEYLVEYEGKDNYPADTLSLLIMFLTAQNNDSLLNGLLKFEHPLVINAITTAYGNSLFKC